MAEFVWPEAADDHFPALIQKNVNQFESVFGLTIALRGNKIMYSGPVVGSRKFKLYLQHLLDLNAENGSLNEADLRLSLSLAEEGHLEQIPAQLPRKHIIRVNGREVIPKTLMQREYVNAIRANELVFGIGPAGTGKTFLAIAMALNFLINRRVQRIVLTRPVVEAGEKLGFLPGDIQQKINPYLRPLYDALYYLIGFEKTTDMIDKGIIEIAPLAYMRGRTINEAFTILDEGQNATQTQMKMFLTRFGMNSRVVVTADITQIDLENPKKSGIFKAIRLLKKIDNIATVYLTLKDIVRHPLVQKIVQAYERES